ncbi:dTMP kinase [Aureimonas leprariae]|uniref:Thymidylate kinase n=1 Tax=Plantimonas leprariae TaxID=2615207 RepID=A0A7V7PRY4_9HYPH|nr:dTMP kinase [Aureimonas leprariae]KAB0681751.1 dTMP kinase [Aureimonas leprariae]
MSGFFITFEGGEGAGKSTQIARLAERLRARRMDVVTTREPGGSEGAEALRHVLLSGAARSSGDPDLEPILFAAARADHVASLIRPALDAGRTVICDRFHDSTRVYQGLAGVDADLIALLEKLAVGITVPNLTIVLDVPAETGVARARERRGSAGPDRFEADDLAVHQRRRQAFLDLAQREPQRCVVVDGSRGVDDVTKEIAFLVHDRLDGQRLERSSMLGDDSII